MTESFDDFNDVRPNALATISVICGVVALVAQVFSCLLCWMPVLWWIPMFVVLAGTAIGLATGLAGRAQAQQTGIGAAAADAGVAMGLLNLTVQLLVCLGLSFACGIPLLISFMDV